MSDILFQFKTQYDLNEQECVKLESQIKAIDSNVLEQQKESLGKKTDKSEDIQPITDFKRSGNQEDIERGKKLIAEGKVATVMVAGGQASRLRLEGPKGCYPVTPVNHKTLYQLFAEKLEAASQQAQYPLQMAIMTSPLNHQATHDYFTKNDWFGMEESQIQLFQQGTLPLLNEEGELFLESRDRLAVGPDGNGGALEKLVSSGILHKWKKSGVDYVNFVMVDNPLADPFDAELIGALDRTQNNVIIKAIERQDPTEKVGVVVLQNGKVRIVEYTELPENTDPFTIANISLFAFQLEFIETVGEIPLHKAHKAVKTIDNKEVPKTPNSWKFERFIFDNLLFAEHIGVLVYPREECFAPLKDLKSLESVQQALQNRDRAILSILSSEPIPNTSIELSQQFHYPTPELLQSFQA